MSAGHSRGGGVQVLGCSIFWPQLRPRRWCYAKSVHPCSLLSLCTGLLALRYRWVLHAICLLLPETCCTGSVRARQQFIYGVVSEGVFVESLRKFCGKFAEICKKKESYCARKGCGHSAESLLKFCGNLRKVFCS